MPAALIAANHGFNVRRNCSREGSPEQTTRGLREAQPALVRVDGKDELKGPRLLDEFSSLDPQGRTQRLARKCSHPDLAVTAHRHDERARRSRRGRRQAEGYRKHFSQKPRFMRYFERELCGTAGLREKSSQRGRQACEGRAEEALVKLQNGATATNRVFLNGRV